MHLVRMCSIIGRLKIMIANGHIIGSFRKTFQELSRVLKAFYKDDELNFELDYRVKSLLGITLNNNGSVI